MTNTPSIFQNLPNDIIMNIIKMETDRARDEKIRKDFDKVMEVIIKCNRFFKAEIEDAFDEEDIDEVGFHTMYFCYR